MEKQPKRKIGQQLLSLRILSFEVLKDKSQSGKLTAACCFSSEPRDLLF